MKLGGSCSHLGWPDGHLGERTLMAALRAEALGGRTPVPRGTLRPRASSLEVLCPQSVSGRVWTSALCTVGPDALPLPGSRHAGSAPTLHLPGGD